MPSEHQLTPLLSGRTAPAAQPRPDVWGWLTLALAVFIFVYNSGASLFVLWLPFDGWLGQQVVGEAGRVELELIQPVTGAAAAALQAGDRVLAVAGRPIDDYAAAALAWRAEPPAGWAEGAHVPYLVRREGRVLTVDVPIRRLSFSAVLGVALPRNLAQAAESLIDLLMLVLGLGVFGLRPNLVPARLLLLFSVSLGTGTGVVPVTTASLMHAPIYWMPHAISSWQLVLLPALAHLLLVFPVVKWPMTAFPRLAAALLYVPGQVGVWLALWLNRAQPAQAVEAYNAVIGLHGLALLVVMVGSAAHSLLRLREPVARTQMAWVTLGLVGGFVCSGALWMVSSLLFAFEGAQALSSAVLLLLPLGLAVAILRYRLMDIEIILNRALVYGSLTALLALAYFGAVVLLQSAVRLLTGQSRSQLVTVLSTLLIAALAQPLRARLQTLIDRRFYRRKYNAAQTLAAFAANVRDDVALEPLSERLVGVVEETMQPAHASLWLRPEGAARPKGARR